jgi:hypothetical protein
MEGEAHTGCRRTRGRREELVEGQASSITKSPTDTNCIIARTPAPGGEGGGEGGGGGEPGDRSRRNEYGQGTKEVGTNASIVKLM